MDLSRLWYDRSVRTQLLVVVGVINLLAAIVAGAIAIYNTRLATHVEIQASLEIAERFVSATLKDLDTQDQLKLEETLPLQLKHLRHVRIRLVDSYGRMTVLSSRGEAEAAKRWVPAWFVSLVRPKLADRAVRVVSGRGMPVIIAGEPVDEIAEAWQNFYVLALVWLALNALILALLYFVLGRVLDPLSSLSRGMLNLEDGVYTTRLKEGKVRELAVITNRFNMLAGALDTAKEENSHLYQRLISVQEQERREIANELHDEAGPCLFGITANASSIKTAADHLPAPATGDISRRAAEILSIVERLKSMNRTLLKKLRPGPIGQVKLAELLDELVLGFQRRHPDTQIFVAIGKLANSYGEATDLTLFRCIQEGLTNAIRHGVAPNVWIDLTDQAPESGSGRKAKSLLKLVLRDDGKGFAPSTAKGFGLTTMTERVRSVGGTCTFESAPAKGTTIRIEIPAQRGRVERPRAIELVGDRP